MKKIILSLLLILLLVSCETLKPGEAFETVSSIVEVPGTTSDELYIRANSWMVDTFNNAKSVIQYSDKESGIIKGKFVGTYPQGLAYLDCESTITVEVKEGKARLTIDKPSSIYNYTQYGKSYATALTIGFVEARNKETDSLVRLFKAAMNTKPSEW